MGVRVLERARDSTPDDRLLATGLAGGPVRLDRREVLGLDRLRRPPRERAHPRRAARQPDALLAHRDRGLLGAAVLGEHPAGERVDLRDPLRHRRGPHWLLDLSQGAATPLPTLGGQALHRHPLLGRGPLLLPPGPVNGRGRDTTWTASPPNSMRVSVMLHAPER